MVLDPELLVVDEPVSSLDASVRGEILALMLQLVRETGVTILVVTHDLGLAWNIADRIAGHVIVEQGTTEELRADPRHPYTRALLSVVPEAGNLEPQILGGEAPDPTRVPAGCRFHPRCPLYESGEARGSVSQIAATARTARSHPYREPRPAQRTRPPATPLPRLRARK
jgi:peptide/nickel transport system ATP-binding protein